MQDRGTKAVSSPAPACRSSLRSKPGAEKKQWAQPLRQSKGFIVFGQEKNAND